MGDNMTAEDKEEAENELIRQGYTDEEIKLILAGTTENEEED